MAAVEEKSMVPTILIGIGGTGAEVLSRVDRKSTRLNSSH